MKELYTYRAILYSLTKKNLFGSYKNSIIGFGWHFFTPVLMLLVYYVVFSELRPSNIDYFWVYLASGLFPFNFMMVNLTGGTGCISNNSALIKKTYFPRELLVFAQVLSTFIASVLGYCAILIIVLISGYALTSWLLMLPLVLCLMLIFTIGFVLIFSSINVYVRDLQYFLNATNLIFYFITPLFFTVDSISGILLTTVQLNPFAYFIIDFQSLVYYGVFPEVEIICISIILSVLMLIVGLIIFNKLKSNFADWL